MNRLMRLALRRILRAYLGSIKNTPTKPVGFSLELPQYSFTASSLEDYCKQVEANRTNPKIRIGYAILVHERPDYLESSLRTLMKSDLSRYDFTLYLIDDGSQSPRVREILSRYADTPSHVKINILLQGKGLSCAGAAINRALTLMITDEQFDFLGFADPDIVYSENWLNKSMQQFLWIESNHAPHKVALYSPFNSQSVAYHRWSGIFDSPIGGYVVKRQMGLVSVLLRPKTILQIGFFDENPNDEEMMSIRMQSLDVYCATPTHSFVEHIGQNSTLNPFRKTEVYRADFSWKLNPKDWKNELDEFPNPSVVRDLWASKSDIDLSKANKIDVAILVAEKDIETFSLCIESLRRHSLNPIENIYVIAAPNIRIQEMCQIYGLEFVNEGRFSFPEISYLDYDTALSRYTWLRQQFIKLSLDELGKQDLILTIDADQVFIKNHLFVLDDVVSIPTVFSFHEPYFQTYERLFSSSPNYISNIAHFMVFNKRHLIEMKNMIEKTHKLPWFEAVFANMDFSESSGFSEFETYGHWAIDHYPDCYKLESFEYLEVARYFYRNHAQLSTEYSEIYESITYPHWKTH